LKESERKPGDEEGNISESDYIDMISAAT